MRGTVLDDARDALEEAGFDEVNEDDHFGDRSVFMSSNWVVVDQQPAAGEAARTDSEVKLTVAKIEDDGVVELLPAKSPVRMDLEERAAQDEVERQEREAEEAQEAAEQAAADAAAAAEAAAAAAADLQSYIDRLDPGMRAGTQLIIGIQDFAAAVAGGQLDSLSFQLGSATVMDAGSSLSGALELVGPPASTNRQVEFDRLANAADAIERAADTLATATGASRDSSLARYNEIWAAAVPEWNAALVALYSGTTVTPPQVP